MCSDSYGISDLNWIGTSIVLQFILRGGGGFMRLRFLILQNMNSHVYFYLVS